MKKNSSLLVGLMLTISAFQTHAGTLFYQAIPASQSDASSGISSDNGYTSAVDGGNTRGTDRVINGITLYAMAANGQSSTADNCTLNALSGSLSNATGSSGSIKADGVCKEVLSDMTFNNGATDNSQQEIVLDPESLESGTTYDLRVYICNSAGQNRQVNLSFVGDGQAAVETGFFNEDDAKTSAGGFTDANQVYYINYRFTWDGDSTPGITITQKSGSAPFCLYALTNQVVSAGGGAAGAGAAGGEGGEGLTSGIVNEESDEVGVASDDFYNSESLNSNGRWVKLDRWGTCWQPTDVPSGWCPYTNGSWKECDDCGWTFVSDEPWAWACYHYGRWCKVRTGCGWAWVPGKVWGASWVSWRRGRGASSSSIGWAPLPPEASCELNVGISTWVDRTCDIGPDYYTFVNIRDFGSDSYWGCGCIYERSRNVTLIIDTFNCTNIYYNRNVIYCGGPDFNWCNTEIRRLGGRELGKIYVNRYTDPGNFRGGKFARQEGNQLALLSPRIKGDKNPKHTPKVAESLGSDKIDKGWDNVKDKNAEKRLRNHIAEESKGKDPKTAKATLPPDVAQKLGKHHGAQADGLTGGGGGGGQHPGKGKLQGQGAAGAGAGAGGTAAAGSTSGFNQHPGGKGKGKGQRAAGAGAGAPGSETAGAGRGTKGRHPGQSLKGQGAGAGGAGAGTAGAGAAGVGAGGGGGGGGQHPGKHKGHGAQGAQTDASGGQAAANIQGGAAQGGQVGGQGAGGRKGRHKGKQTQGQTLQGGTQGGQGGMNQGTADQAGQGGQGAGGGKGRHKQRQQTQGQTLQGGQGTQASGTGGTGGQGQGGKGHRKQQQPTQQLQQTQGQGGGGGGGGQHHKQRQLQSNQQQQYQQQQYQQQQQQQQQQQKRGGRKGKKPTPTATPYP